MHKNPFFLIPTFIAIIFMFGSLFLFYSLPTQSAYQEIEPAAQQAKFMPELIFNPLPENKAIKIGAAVPKKITEAADPYVNPGAAVIMDSQSGKIIFSKDANSPRAIASITKLATALVFLDNNPGWEAEYEIKHSDRVNGGKIYLFSGEKVKIKDLFYLSLVGSANTATLALVNSTGLSETEFVAAMNAKAKDLNLKNTNFVDSIGLSHLNRSTAYEAAKLAKAAFENEDISRAVMSKEYFFTTAGGRKKIVYNTDSLLKSFPINGIKLSGGKTGYTPVAGYCFAGKFKNESNQEIFVVILGGENHDYRFQKTKELALWTYNNFSWKYY
ncbi:MAG: serine hydrolase [Patescibacteria group bacterium]|nr:serine hydrolase [Patescibacteria group bacterium]